MDAIERWHNLLRDDDYLTPEFCRTFSDSMRARRLTFGDRVHCPFLRPFFLSATDESRIRRAAETLASAGERVAQAALESRPLFDQLGITEPEEKLIRIDPGYGTASTASRLDAFLLPDSLHFAEYNAESPAGPGYTQRLAELFDALPVMARFKNGRDVRFHRPIEKLLEALIGSYREWGGTASPPAMAIVDWREVPTWTEFEILRDAFEASGVPTFVCDPRELVFENGVLTAGGRRIDLVYRRVLINDIVARPGECAALVDACEAGAVCVANTFRCKIPHKKAFFAVLTDPRNDALFAAEERSIIRAHVPWTRVLEDIATEKNGARSGLLDLVRAQRDQFVLKPNDELRRQRGPAWLGDVDKSMGRSVDVGAERSARDVDRPGTHPSEARNFPAIRYRWKRRDAGRARRFRPLSVPWSNGWVPDTPQRQRPGERNGGGRAGAGVCA